MRIYLASRYSRREELCDFRSVLFQAGHEVTSRWLNGNHQVSDDGFNAEGPHFLRERFALEDLQDLESCDCLISFTEPPRSGPMRGGRHVEFGIAMALRKSLIVVGPRENVFHCLPRVAVVPYARAALPILENWSFPLYRPASERSEQAEARP